MKNVALQQWLTTRQNNNKNIEVSKKSFNLNNLGLNFGLMKMYHRPGLCAVFHSAKPTSEYFTDTKWLV